MHVIILQQFMESSFNSESGFSTTSIPLSWDVGICGRLLMWNT